MLKRKIVNKLNLWKNSKFGLLIDGARQVGKTFIIRDFLKNNFKSWVEINLSTNLIAVSTLNKSIDYKDFLLRLSTLIDRPLISGETVIFIDEIQEFKDFDFITILKDLIDKTDYRFIISGSLLGVEEFSISSWPRGYLITEKMYPLDFEEFLWAKGISQDTINVAKNAINKFEPIPDYINDRFLKIYKEYLIVGGMPNAVDEFIKSNDLNKVSLAQKTINQYYEKDIAKYIKENEKILIKAIYDLIPYELNNQSKRFSLKDLSVNYKSEYLGLSFAWLIKAGIAIPIYNVDSLTIPLVLASSRKLLKLFQNDCGILTYRMMNNDIRLNIINDKYDYNIGAIYENSVAQSLYSKGLDNLYFYNKKKFGEIDFLIESKDEISIFEVKSGKNFYTHSTLNKVKGNPSVFKYVKKCFVLYNGNINRKDNAIYLPIYSIVFLNIDRFN